MAIIGMISRVPHITKDEFQHIADRHIELTRPSARTLKNPFNGETTTVPPTEGEFNIVLSGATVGAIAPSAEFDDDGEWDIFAGDEGDRKAIRELISSIARQLDARTSWLDD